MTATDETLQFEQLEYDQRYYIQTAKNSIESLGHIARHFSASGRKSLGPISWHSAWAAGNTHGCALLMYMCAIGVSHLVSSSVPARRLTICSRPARSP